MTPQQVKTALRLAWLGVGCAVIVIGALVIEGLAVAQGGSSTISEIFWIVWAHQPWVIFLVSHVLAAPFWFLGGHFLAQSKEVYDGIRRGK